MAQRVRMNKPIIIFFFSLLLGVTGNLFAEEKTSSDTDAGAPVSTVKIKPYYFHLYPAIITNLAEGESGPAFIQMRITLMVYSNQAAEELEYHEPLIRDYFITTLATKKKNDMRSGNGRRAFRQAAVGELRELLESQTGRPLVEDILFTNVIVE
ncbi:MAG: flagellar basal body-associated protein FliL [Gammaproteobacteria bacterium]